MGLDRFVAREPRPLPIFILADTSGSMRGEKINELNLALREMLNALNATDDIRGKFQLCVISFGKETEVLQPLADIEGLAIPELTAAGKTPMGQAFELVKGLIEDSQPISKLYEYSHNLSHFPFLSSYSHCLRFPARFSDFPHWNLSVLHSHSPSPLLFHLWLLYCLSDQMNSFPGK